MKFYALWAWPLVFWPLVVLAQQPPANPPHGKTALLSKIQRIEALLPKLADRGAGLDVLAVYYARLGDTQKALHALKECVALDEGFDPAEDEEFQSLHGKPEFQAFAKEAQRHYPAVKRAHLAYTVPEKDIVPEGLASSRDGGLYMSSLYRRKIVKIASDGAVSDFTVPAEPLWGDVCGLKEDPVDQGVWAAACPDVGQSELLHFNSHGKLVERFAPPTAGDHGFNDLVLRGTREIYLTDTDANQAYRFDRITHTFTPLPFPRPVYGPNGIALSDDGNQLYVADIFGITHIDLVAHSSVELNPGPHNSVMGVDGLYWYRDGLVAVQNGGMRRVIQVRLKGDTVKTLRVLESRSPLISIPTTGAIVGRNFYFISNSQVDNLKDEKILDERKLEPVKISVVPLSNL